MHKMFTRLQVKDPFESLIKVRHTLRKLSQIGGIPNKLLIDLKRQLKWINFL